MTGQEEYIELAYAVVSRAVLDVLGLYTGEGAAYFLHHANCTVRSKDSARRFLLGQIPHSRFWWKWIDRDPFTEKELAALAGENVQDVLAQLRKQKRKKVKEETAEMDSDLEAVGA